MDLHIISLLSLSASPSPSLPPTLYLPPTHPLSPLSLPPSLCLSLPLSLPLYSSLSFSSRLFLISPSLVNPCYFPPPLPLSGSSLGSKPCCFIINIIYNRIHNRLMTSIKKDYFHIYSFSKGLNGSFYFCLLRYVVACNAFEGAGLISVETVVISAVHHEALTTSSAVFWPLFCLFLSIATVTSEGNRRQRSERSFRHAEMILVWSLDL